MVMEARPSTKSGRTKKAPPAQNRAKAYKKRVEAHMRAVAERVAEAHVPAPR